MNLMLAPGILENAIDHAKACYPNEGCGLVVGREAGERFIPMTNVSGSASRFEMDAGELINSLRDMRGRGEELIAIYHSHPHGSAEPSKTDIEQAHYPEAAHLIISLGALERPQAAAFRIVDGEVLGIEVHVIV